MDEILAVLRAAGEATRLRILALLRSGELTVGEIVSVLDQSQPRVSRHLKLLCEAGLLDRFREGTLIFYRLSEQNSAKKHHQAILGWLDNFDSIVQSDQSKLATIRRSRFEAAQAYFTDNAAKWDEIRSLYVPEQQVEQALLDCLEERYFSNILDIGTGTARMLELFAPQCDQGLGLDVSLEMLGHARSHLLEKNLDHCTVRRGDMYDLPIEDESQDLVLFHQVLHFADDPALAIKESCRVLRPNAQMLIADFAPHDEEFLRDEHAHRRLGFADDEIINIAAMSGLNASGITHLTGGRLDVTIWQFCANSA